VHRGAVYSDDPCRSDSPDPERRIAVIHTQSAAGPVTGGGVLGRLAGNLALERTLLGQSLRGDGAQRQRRNQRVSHSANASTLRASASSLAARGVTSRERHSSLIRCRRLASPLFVLARVGKPQRHRTQDPEKAPLIESSGAPQPYRLLPDSAEFRLETILIVARRKSSRAAKNRKDSASADLPHSPGWISVVDRKAAAGPVAGRSNLRRLAGNFALFGSLREGSRGDSAHRQRRNQRVSHAPNACTTRLAASTAGGNRHIAAAT